MTVDVSVLAAVLAELCVIVAAIAAGVVWLRRWLRHQVVAPVQEIRSEVSQDNGFSMRDAVDRIERDLGKLAVRYDDHLRIGHAGGKAPP